MLMFFCFGLVTIAMPCCFGGYQLLCSTRDIYANCMLITHQFCPIPTCDEWRGDHISEKKRLIQGNSCHHGRQYAVYPFRKQPHIPQYDPKGTITLIIRSMKSMQRPSVAHAATINDPTKARSLATRKKWKQKRKTQGLLKTAQAFTPRAGG